MIVTFLMYQKMSCIVLNDDIIYEYNENQCFNSGNCGGEIMNEKTMNIINVILYYVVAPILVLEFLLADLKVITFTKIIFGISVLVFGILVGIIYFYKRKHPDYEFKVNDLYTKILFVIILMECFYSAGFFQW